MLIDFPEHYPEQCPPFEATNADGVVYRLTKTHVLDKLDFCSHYELRPDKDWGDMACQARGLSVFPSVEACEEIKKKIPSIRKNNKGIATANLNNNHGKFANTPSTNSKRHMTWWVSSNLKEPWTLFSNVDN